MLSKWTQVLLLSEPCLQTKISLYFLLPRSIKTSPRAFVKGSRGNKSNLGLLIIALLYTPGKEKGKKSWWTDKIHNSWLKSEFWLYLCQTGDLSCHSVMGMKKGMNSSVRNTQRRKMEQCGVRRGWWGPSNVFSRPSTHFFLLFFCPISPVSSPQGPTLRLSCSWEKPSENTFLEVFHVLWGVNYLFPAGGAVAVAGSKVSQN